MATHVSSINVHGLTPDDVKIGRSSGTVWMDIGERITFFPEGIFGDLGVINRYRTLKAVGHEIAAQAGTALASLRDESGHTAADFDTLLRAGVDPFTVQPRERETVCSCGETTWNISASCDLHYVAPSNAREVDTVETVVS